eukprot:2634055-Ditylum_brightwellii.AAC.1
MMFAMRVLNAIKLKVKLPMTLFMDNKGVKDFAKNWSIGGRTRHVKVKQYFLRELKEAGVLEIQWKKGKDTRPDISTKNCDGPTFEKYMEHFVGHDKLTKG